ncbi:VOC family protein [Geodermatophilus sp. FMUSA9-8]|uniref:VOC family protein n=1 Tax=Geodermatophilus sp. FMUSA9-8 TaxID=3120155 RepID=UPI00300A29CD
MPHRSRLAVLLLDLPPEVHAAGTDFWSAATGNPVEPDMTDPAWHRLGMLGGRLSFEVQRTGEGTPPRWHVDVETDDIPAEVARLEALGARRLRHVEAADPQGRGLCQMTDPAGLVFCVVAVQDDEAFGRSARTWP